MWIISKIMEYSNLLPILGTIIIINWAGIMKPKRYLFDFDDLISQSFVGGLHLALWDKLSTHWGPDKITAILQMTISNAFSWKKMLEFWLKFHWSLFLRIQLTIFQLFGADQATSHYLNQWWLDYQCIYASLGLNEFNFVTVDQTLIKYAILWQQMLWCNLATENQVW